MPVSECCEQKCLRVTNPHPPHTCLLLFPPGPVCLHPAFCQKKVLAVAIVEQPMPCQVQAQAIRTDCAPDCTAHSFLNCSSGSLSANAIMGALSSPMTTPAAMHDASCRTMTHQQPSLTVSNTRRDHYQLFVTPGMTVTSCYKHQACDNAGHTQLSFTRSGRG
jgi:hypothetical protein